MSKALLVLVEGGKVSRFVDGSTKEFRIEKISESEGSIRVTMLADDGDVFSLAFAQKTGEEYWADIKSAVDGFVGSTGDKLSQFASELSGDLQSIGDAIGKLNLTKRAQDALTGIFGSKDNGEKKK
jgi:hypothetical protein